MEDKYQNVVTIHSSTPPTNGTKVILDSPLLENTRIIVTLIFPDQTMPAPTNISVSVLAGNNNNDSTELIRIKNNEQPTLILEKAYKILAFEVYIGDVKFTNSQMVAKQFLLYIGFDITVPRTID